MDKDSFDSLAASLREAVAISKGTVKPARIFSLDRPSESSHRIDVRQVREQTGLSQTQFALLLQVSVRTLQNWEKKRQQPAGPAAALLAIVAKEPQLALRTLRDFA
jgi:DNA-binding transcriptional regulator YiaG